MRIAFLADASLPHTLRWVNWFATHGHECRLASVERGDGFACPVEWLPARATLPRFVRYTLAVPRVRAWLRDFQPDVVNAHFLPNYGWLATRAGARPLVLTALGSDILLVPKQSPLHRWRTVHVLQRVQAATSDAAMLTQALGGFGLAADRILTVPFGIEAARFAAPAVRVERPIVVLQTRRLEPVYDVGTLLDAWEKLDAPTRAEMELRIAGGGSQQAALQARAAGQPIQFLGWLSMPALDEALRAAHVYVSASLSDSTSVSLLEAMAAGCFPVVSDLEANREWLVEGESGLFFPPGDAAALAAALRRAASDPALRAGAAAQNRATIAARATWESNMAQVESFFERFAGEHRTG